MQLTVGRCADLTSQLEVYERNKDRLFAALTEYGFSCVEPGGSFYMFPRSLEPDDVAFCKKATELDLFLVPGTLRAAPATSAWPIACPRSGSPWPCPNSAAGGAVSEEGLKYFLCPSFKSNFSTVKKCCDIKCSNN